MDLSTVLGFLSSLVAPVLGWLKKPLAERTAVRNPSSGTHSPSDELNKATFVHLGANSSTEESWKRILEVFTRVLVLSEPFSSPHVREWLSMAETQRQLQRLSDARISCSTEPPEARMALIDSYMEASGEHQSRAEDIVSHVVKVALVKFEWVSFGHFYQT